MSLKSAFSNSVKSNNEPPQWVKQSSTETNVKLAGEEAKDRLYEPKHKKKLVRVLTVVAYIFSVSLAAIMLSLYYIFIWNPDSKAKLIGDTAATKPKYNDCPEFKNQEALAQIKMDDSFAATTDTPNTLLGLGSTQNSLELESFYDEASSETKIDTDSNEINENIESYEIDRNLNETALL